RLPRRRGSKPSPRPRSRCFRVRRCRRSGPAGRRRRPSTHWRRSRSAASSGAGASPDRASRSTPPARSRPAASPRCRNGPMTARAAFRASVRRFVEREIAPHVDAWDEAGSFPRELYVKAADAGLIGLGYPEHLGGTPAPMAWRLIATEEVARAGSGGLLASLFSHSIGLPPVIAHGSDALQRRIVPDILAGRKIAALAISEPGAGSDVA